MRDIPREAGRTDTLLDMTLSIRAGGAGAGTWLVYRLSVLRHGHHRICPPHTSNLAGIHSGRAQNCLSQGWLSRRVPQVMSPAK